MSDVRTGIDGEGGRYRAVVEVEVPGTPEQVWTTIATGPGIEAWFVPAEVEPWIGGTLVTHHGSYGESVGIVTAWEPPRRLAYDEADWQGPEVAVPVWNTEVLVEAASGGTCIVRLSSGFLADGDDWHDDVDQTLEGWTDALRNLRLYLTHFAGQPTTTLIVHQEVPHASGAPDAIAAAGLADARPGEPVETTPPVPRAVGVAEHRRDGAVTVRTTDPVPGLLAIAGMEYEGTAMLVVQWCLYGPDGQAVRDREKPAWEEWAAGVAARSAQA